MADKKHVTTRSNHWKDELEGDKETGKKWGKKKTPWKLTSVFPPARPSERNRKLAAPTALQNNGEAGGKKRAFFKIPRGKEQKDSAEEKISR